MTPSPAESALEPCPFCFGEAALRRGAPNQMRCRMCGAEGPEATTGNGALEAWNARAELARIREERDDARMMLRAVLEGRFKYNRVRINGSPWWLLDPPCNMPLPDDGTGLPKLTAEARAKLGGT